LGIKLNIINLEEIEKESFQAEKITEETKKSFSFKKLIEKLIDCCKE